MSLKEAVDRENASQESIVINKPIIFPTEPKIIDPLADNETQHKSTLSTLAQECGLPTLLNEAVSILQEDHKNETFSPSLEENDFIDINEHHLKDAQAYKKYTLHWWSGNNHHLLPIFVNMEGTIFFYAKYMDVKHKLPLFFYTFDRILGADSSDTITKTEWQNNNSLIQNRLAFYLVHPKAWEPEEKYPSHDPVPFSKGA